MSYKCQLCKKNCKQLYSNKTRKKWICVKCWEKENNEKEKK